MDEELLELQRQFEFAQQAKSSIRLSERNVVELVQKLHELQIIDFDLLHTVSGKEYITPEQLRLEIVAEVNRLGRVSLIDLADSTGVDLYHVEKQAQVVVSSDHELMLIQGEIISSSYWDTVAEEINERLQECSQIAVAELAAQLQVGSELVSSMLESRLGTLIQGRLEGGQLYTPAYVTRVNAMVRGAARGITVPMNLSALWSSLQQLLQAMDGATGVAMDNSFFQSLFNSLVKEAEILGSLRAGVHWTPAVFAAAQKEFVDSFLSQNSFISYDSLQKLGIPQPMQYLQSRYPDGVPLVTMFIHPSMIEMLDAAIEDAIERNSWIDCLTVLPTLFGSQDASKILSLCPSIQSALKSSRALILGESYVLSDGFVKDVFSQLEKEMQTFSVSVSAKLGDEKNTTKENKCGNDSGRLPEPSDNNVESGSKPGMEKGSKKKKGKSGNSRNSASDDLDNQEPVPTKSKKNQRKGKDISASHVSESKKSKEDNVAVPSEDWIVGKLLSLVPEFEEQGMDDQETILKPLANHLRPMLLTSWNERRKAMLAENSDRMKRVLDNLQKKLDESYLNMQLYEKALDLFEDDQATSVVLHRHLLRTTGASIADMLLFNLDAYNKLKNGIAVEESQNSEPVSLSPGERNSIAKSLLGSLSVKAVALVESMEGKRIDTFMIALAAAAEESGLFLKRLDKKLEKTLVHSYRKDLASQVSAETDPVSLLPKVVSLLYLKVHNKALQAPGRAMSVAVSRLKDKLDDTAYKTLMDYHSATVALLASTSAATHDGDEVASDGIPTKKEVLESLMPSLKSLVLGTSQPQGPS
uniref:E3 UFM1-protein ligase 1 homolog n=1 Tax=Opuntia streptacantha TaxID=393608 RepID=A0A7C9DWZ8_OPUST